MSRHETTLLSKEQIAESIEAAGKTLSEKYKGKQLHFVVIMKGALFFAADLMRTISIPCTFSYMQAKSYTGTTQTDVEITQMEETDFTGKSIIILDDVFDTGKTLHSACELLKKQGPLSIETMVLIDKQKNQHRDFTVDYVLNTVEDHFLIGYGLDMHEYERNLPEIRIYEDS